MARAKEAPLSYSDRLAFIGLNDESFDNGLALWSIIEPEADAILADFYAHLEKFTPQSMFSRMDIGRLAYLQKQHWKRLFTKFYSEEYVDAATNIGLAHDDVGLSAEWYIGGYIYLSNRMTDVILSHHVGNEEAARAAISLLNRLIGLDMGTVMSVYQAD